MDFEELLSEYKRRRSLNSAESTVSIYTTHVQNWQDWLIENRDKDVWEVDSVDLLIFVEQLTNDGLAPSSINQRTSAISKFYQDMEKLAGRGYDMPDIPENPYDGFDDEDRALLNGDTKKKQGMEDTTQNEYPYLSSDEVSELIENVQAPRLRNELIIRLLFNCGFRRGELANCKLKHIDRDDSSIFIPPRKSESRYVSYNEDYLGFWLDQWIDYGERDSMTYASESEYLFPTNESEHISGDHINQIVKDAAKEAELQETLNEYADGREIHKVTAHTLRHSFAMQSIKSGVHVKTLQTLMGHTELDTTLIYLQQSKDEAKEESRMFDPEL